MPELRVILTACALLLAMVLSALIGRRQRIGAVVLALLSLVWLTIDRDFEGAVLITVGSGHGLVASDLVGVAGFAIALALVVRVRR